MRISDWSSDVCSSDLAARGRDFATRGSGGAAAASSPAAESAAAPAWAQRLRSEQNARHRRHMAMQTVRDGDRPGSGANPDLSDRSEEHTSELQSLMRTSYAVFCLKKKTY